MAPRLLLCALLALAGSSTCFSFASDSRADAKPSPPAIVAKFEDGDLVNPVRLSDGQLLGLSILTEGRNQHVLGRYSQDNGKSWTIPKVLFALSTEQGGFGSWDAFTDRDGEVHIFLLNDGNSGIFLPKSASHKPIRAGEVKDIWHLKTSGKGTRWDTPPTRIWTGRAGDLLSVIQLESGRILLPICYETSRSWSNRGRGADAFTYVGWFNSSVIYSDDDGETWRQSPDELVAPVPDGETLGAIEPVVLPLKDGRVWMLLRTQLGRFYESFSRDEGVHWSRPKPTGITSSDSPAALVRLADGRILMIWNEASRFPYAYGGRHVLHAAISSDEGLTWQGYREIVRDPLRSEPPPSRGDFGVAYVFPVLAPNGSVVFSAGVQTGAARYLYRLDPRWLLEKRQQTDFSSGIDDWSAFGVRGVALSDGYGSHPMLAIRRSDPDWPSGAVWNFPLSPKGSLHLRLMLRDNFGGDVIGLTDHYSVPFDEQDTYFNIYNLPLNKNGELLSHKLTPHKMYDLQLQWDMASGDCSVRLDGEEIGTLKAQRSSVGINYLRFHVTSDREDGGLLVRSVETESLSNDAAQPNTKLGESKHVIN